MSKSAPIDVDLAGSEPNTVCAILMPALLVPRIARCLADGGIHCERDDPNDTDPPLTFVAIPSRPMIEHNLSKARGSVTWSLIILAALVAGFLAFSWADQQFLRGMYLILMVNFGASTVIAFNKLNHHRHLLKILPEENP